MKSESCDPSRSGPNASGSVLELTCRHTADGLFEATAGSNRIEDGRWISVQLPGVELPIIGEIDVEAGGPGGGPGVIEIKTRWPYLSAKAARGWSINSLPPRPDPNHVTQIGLYWHWLRQSSDHSVPATLVYANCRGYRIFRSTDTAELSEEALCEAVERLRAVAIARERLMQQATDVDHLLAMMAPDFSHFMWQSVTPEYRAAAEAAWSTARASKPPPPVSPASAPAPGGFDELPDWALRFNFTAHSASGVARPDAKEFFEKCVARPKKIRDRAGCPATAGRACEAYAKSKVIDGWDDGQAFRAALSTFDQHLILDHIRDREKFFVIRDAIYEPPVRKKP